MTIINNGSYWFDSLDEPVSSDAPESLPAQVDVAIIGAGYTGLWSAYYLKQHQPDLSIAVFEANTVGFGASGRNGGWCMGWAYGIDYLLSQKDKRAQGMAIARAMEDTVDEVGRISQAENIDCHFQKGGTLTVATMGFRVEKAQRQVKRLHELGFTEDDFRWLPEEESRKRLNMTPNFGAVYTPHCAAIHPARLVRGLARVLRNKGVAIIEQTPVVGYESGKLQTARGDVKADKIIRATEGYTESVKGHSREVLPLYSMMVATEPLPELVWEEIGLHERETFGDSRRVVIYGQRTLDGRFAFGGRAGYYFGSERKPVIPHGDPGPDKVEHILREHFPMLEGYEVTHKWGGLMGVYRHWRPCVTFDHASGLGSAGGYVGEGVGASNLAGRIMADLVLERDTDITHLGWVDDHAKRWEPEPLRWLGARAIAYFGELADDYEVRNNKPSTLWGGIVNRFVG